MPQRKASERNIAVLHTTLWNTNEVLLRCAIAEREQELHDRGRDAKPKTCQCGQVSPLDKLNGLDPGKLRNKPHVSLEENGSSFDEHESLPTRLPSERFRARHSGHIPRRLESAGCHPYETTAVLDKIDREASGLGALDQLAVTEDEREFLWECCLQSSTHCGEMGKTRGQKRTLSQDGKHCGPMEPVIMRQRFTQEEVRDLEEWVWRRYEEVF